MKANAFEDTRLTSKKNGKSDDSLDRFDDGTEKEIVKNDKSSSAEYRPNFCNETFTHAVETVMGREKTWAIGYRAVALPWYQRSVA